MSMDLLSMESMLLDGPPSLRHYVKPTRAHLWWEYWQPSGENAASAVAVVAVLDGTAVGGTSRPHSVRRTRTGRLSDSKPYF